ncbi:F-box/LRR-repeat protein 2-like [Dendronephthya gigantea]|uniref:F-box/LRR-repeat protein 2-like n=1 Tax=Dendronephthya gigantea TaxID=151771 RepID=UPI00106C7B23|nr:F-box/LRR-repeat protein 2-like [Dendronephthya gigantea]
MINNVENCEGSINKRFQVLPIEVIVHQIFEYLDIKEVCTCRLVSKKWNYYSITNLQSRHELDFAGMPVISDSGLNAILRIARQLRVVRLDDCWTCTTEENLFLLANNCPNLSILSVSRCKYVTDDAIKKLCECCKNLQELDVSNCFKVSDKGLSSVTLSKNLHSLSVRSCYGVTDRSIKRITSQCLKLMVLDVSCCPRVTDVGLQPLLEKPSKQYIRIKSCQNVSVGMISKLVTAGITVNDIF